MGKARVNMEVGNDGVAFVTFSKPPINSLDISVFRDLKQKYDEAIQRNDVKAIVLAGHGGKFSGGFDIDVLEEIQNNGDMTETCQMGMELQNTIEEARKPSVAALEGLALGGGLEIAMCCHARIATPKTQFGLPELQLGIIPGGGGTQRLPRLIGLSKAVEMLLMSKTIGSEEAKDLGLINDIIPPHSLLDAARKWALDIANFHRPWIMTLYRTDKLEPLGEAREILKFARSQVKKTAPNLNHPCICLDVIEEGVLNGGIAGIHKEVNAFVGCVSSDTAKSLVHVFSAQRSTTKIPGVTDLGIKPRPIKKVGVIGGGLMGSGIATAFVQNNIPVVLKEVNQEFLNAGLNRIRANLESNLKKGKLTQDKFDKILSLVKGVLDYEEFKDVNLVIEAVVEKLPLKQQIFSDIEKICHSNCLLTTNTSTLNLDLVGNKTTSQHRIAGAHFFSPAHIMPLLEIVRTQKTSPQVLVDLIDVGKKIKKLPVVVGNCPGFGVNRTFFPYSQSALMLVDLGVDPYRIDGIITAFGMPMGPFRLADLVGLEVNVAVGMTYLEAYPERAYKSLLLNLMIEDKRCGENNRGFYVYDNKKKARPDPDLNKYLEKSRAIANIMPNNKPLSISDEEILERMFFPVVNEACRVLEEGIVTKASDLNIASVMGMGFPPYRGGIIFWADSVGPKHIATRLKTWSETYGGFFRPCAWLEHCATRGIKLSTHVEEEKSRL